MELIKFNLVSKVIEHQNKNIKISNFLPSHLQNILIDMDDNDYIFGVQYQEKNDIQIGITGSGNYKENNKRTLTREMAEELKLYPFFDMIENDKEYKENKREWFCCKINIKNTQTSLRQDFYQEHKVKNWRKKIGVFVYGNYDNMYKILSTNYNTYLSNDNISHIVMIKVGWIKQYIKNFKEWYKPKKIKNKDYFMVNI